MRTDVFSVLVVTLWAATTPGTAYHREERNGFVEKIADPTYAFATTLLKNVAKESGSGNVIMSPLSVSTLLAMVQQGARERSANQLQDVLQLSSEDSKNGYKSLLTSLKNREPGTVLKFGNSIFLNQNFDLLPDFQLSMDRDFHAKVNKVEFGRPAAAAAKINGWVSNATNGNINDIVSPGSFTGRTEMVLVNAVYFNGKWNYPFAREKTAKTLFYKSANEPPINVDMMRLEQTLRAGEDKKHINAKWVELPYDDYVYSLIVLLPNDNVEDLIRRLGASQLSFLATTSSVREVKLKMPKFKLESSLTLAPIMQTMGIQDIFSQNSNLEGISVTKRPLIVSEVLHKARINVNEEGSEASAASAIYVNTLSLTPDYDSLEITFDRPFLAIIMDKISKLPLFMAKVSDPTKT